MPPNAGHHLPAEGSSEGLSSGILILRWLVRCMALLDVLAPLCEHDFKRPVVSESIDKKLLFVGRKICHTI